MPKLNPFPLVLDSASGGSGDYPQLATIEQTRKALNCSRTKIFDLLNQGTLDRRKIGRATRVTVASIERLLRNESAPIDVEFNVVNEGGNN